MKEIEKSNKNEMLIEIIKLYSQLETSFEMRLNNKEMVVNIDGWLTKSNVYVRKNSTEVEDFYKRLFYFYKYKWSGEYYNNTEELKK